MVFADDRQEGSPLERLKSEHISTEGLIALKLDPSLHKATRERLYVTEKDTVLNSRFRKRFNYLLDPEHDIKKAYKENFGKNNDCGLAHIAAIIKDNYSEPIGIIISEYATDRDIPFLIAMILIDDLIKVDGTLYEIKSKTTEGNVIYKRIPWTAKEQSRLLPITDKKNRLIHNDQSIPGLHDDMILESLIEANCDLDILSKKLNLSKPTLRKRLYQIGLTEDMIPNITLVKEWKENKKRDLERQEMSGKKFVPGTKGLPVKQGKADGSKFDLPPERDLLRTYFENNCDTKIVSAQMAIPEPILRDKILAMISGNQNKRTDDVVLAAAEVYIDDIAKAADAVNMDPEYYRKRLLKILKGG